MAMSVYVAVIGTVVIASIACNALCVCRVCRGDMRLLCIQPLAGIHWLMIDGRWLMVDGIVTLMQASAMMQ